MTDHVRGKLDGIVRLLNDGRMDDAESTCRGYLIGDPDEINLLGILGAMLIRKGDLDEAEQHLRRAIGIEPGFAKPHEDMGAIYLARNDPHAAISYFERARTLDSDNSSATRGLGVAYQRAGKDVEAQALRQELMQTTATPNLLGEANALRLRGEPTQAEQLCDAILKREPENTDALSILAVAASDDERYVIAEGYLRRIVKLKIDDPDSLFDLANFLGERGRYPEAIEFLQSAAALAPENPDVQLHLGNLHGIVGQTADALGAYENCLGIRPDDPAALIGQGHMLRISGQQDEANASYKRSVEVSPEIGSTWWYLASLHRYSASDEEVVTMESQLESESLAPDSKIAFHFALARAFEKRENFPAAWEQYVQGNSLKRSIVKYDPVKIEVDQDRIKNVFNANFLASVSAQTPTAVTPIFVLGMPRSGSTLIEQILGSHSSLEGVGELPYVLMLTSSMIANKPDNLHYTEIMQQLSSHEITALGRSYLYHASTHCADETMFFTDKMPENFSHVGFIRSILPHAKIIDARREPMATCVANYRQLFAQGKTQTYDLNELGEYYLRYIDMMAHWDAVLPGEVLRVQYEEVVADLEGQVRRILDFCGLPFEQSCVEYHKSDRPVNTASSEQVREPIYTSAVEFWRNFDPYLEELREVLEPVL
ncbi:MAG: tetratricopeptide repeat protein [Woeseia sp.]|nr:tetratricopeptide repeat protein [Woeseia sp.]MBT6211706.1 tetratricopeptide repeat protein [Woeseia sp.]